MSPLPTLLEPSSDFVSELEHFSEQAQELSLFSIGQRAGDLCQGFSNLRERLCQMFAARIRDGDAVFAAVIRVWVPLHEPLLLEKVHDSHDGGGVQTHPLTEQDLGLRALLLEQDQHAVLPSGQAVRQGDQFDVVVDSLGDFVDDETDVLEEAGWE
jgi:hypothetical protein